MIRSEFVLPNESIDHEPSAHASVYANLITVIEDLEAEDGPSTCGRYGQGTRKGIGGRVPIEKKFPTLIPEMQAFIDSSGFEAHRRRHSTTGNCGVTVKQIQEQLYSAVPNLREHGCSLHTIRRLLQAPDRRFNNSKLYRGLVDAKAKPPSRTSASKNNDNDHYYSARVKYVMEMATKFSESTTVFSIDNKNKVKIGDDISAVDRRCTNRKIYPVNDQPILPDHDFHTSGMFVQIPGYLDIDLPTQGTRHFDDKGREHYVMSRRGKLHVRNRPGTAPVTIAEHMNDIIRLLERCEQVKPFLVLVADNGADYRPNSITNEVFYSRLFRRCNLDSMVVCTYCPGHSALNFIEHGWAPLTAKLTGVKLTDKIPGENIPPWQQGLDPEEKADKIKQVYDNAMRAVEGYFLRGVTFCEYPIDVETYLCDSVETPYTDYRRMYGLLTGTQANLHQPDNVDVVDELQFHLSHVERRVGLLHFTKCETNECQHCLTHPIRCDRDVFNFIKLHGVPSPQPSITHQGSFMTYMEAIEDQPPPYRDQHMPDVLRLSEKGIGRCDFCPYYQFSSSSNKAAHLKLAHPNRQRRRRNQNDQAVQH